MKILDDSLSPSRLILHPLGMWPDEDRKKWRLRCVCFLSISIMFYFSSFSQTVLLPKIWGDLDAVIDVLTTTTLPVTVVVLKTSSFSYNGDGMKLQISFVLLYLKKFQLFSFE